MEDSGWAELLRSFGTQRSAGIKYAVPGIRPPEYDGDVVAELEYCEDDMKRVCLNRQRNGMTNGAFMDFSVRRIGLKELWKLRWHRHWSAERSQVGTPEWPVWMSSFRDY